MSVFEEKGAFEANELHTTKKNNNSQHLGEKHFSRF